MKKHITHLMLAVLVVVSMIAGTVFTSKTEASVAVGNDYKSVEFTSSNASSTAPTIVKSGPGSLGSIIIASSTTGAIFRVYDNAVSTSSATSTRIVSFPASASAGTYTFDREIQRGIVVEAPAGFNGSYVVTYR